MSRGRREYNLALGARRAKCGAGIPDLARGGRHRLTTVSFGKERPIEICSTEKWLFQKPSCGDGADRFNLGVT